MSRNKLLRASSCALLMVGFVACTDEIQTSIGEAAIERAVANNYPQRNATGHSASFSTQGEVALDGEFFQAQGSNGRSCATCHVPEDGWSITPATAQRFFDDTDGTHPLFSRLDADRPNYTDSQLAAMSIDQRRQVFSMLLAGMFTRSVSVPATRDYDVTAASDPFGVGTTSKLWFFRRSVPTANFKSHTVMSDSANTVGTDLYAGLVKQARGNVTGAQQGPAATDAVIFDIVDYEFEMSNAQLIVPGVGRLDSDGARGGPEAHAYQSLAAGRFDLFDAWALAGNPRRRQIYRGQELFNQGDRNGKQCAGCHNAQNSGQNVDGRLFNIGTSNPKFANANMAVYTFTRRSDGATLKSTDPGRGIRNGVYADLNKFKTPTLRGLAARAPYFHNGIAATIPEIVTFYEKSLGFDFSTREEADLAAFLNAL